VKAPSNNAIPQRSVEDGEELPHTRRHGNLLEIARREPPSLELLEEGVVAGGDKLRHGRGGPNRKLPTLNVAFPSGGAGVGVEGGNSYQSREAPSGKCSQSGRLCQRRPLRDRTHAWHAPQAHLIFHAGGARLNRLVELPLRATYLLQPMHVGADASGHRLGLHLEAGRVDGDEHLQEQSPAGEDGLQGLYLLGEDAWTGTNGSGEASEHAGVDLIGLGETSRGLSKVAGLTRVYNRHRDSAGGDGRGDEGLVLAGGLQDHSLRRYLRLRQTGEELVYVDPVIGNGEDTPAGQRVDVEALLGDVYPDDVSLGELVVSVGSSRGLKAQKPGPRAHRSVASSIAAIYDQSAREKDLLRGRANRRATFRT
jgi:hypothetical protein